MGSIFFEFLATGGAPSSVVWATDKLTTLAAIMKIPAIVMFILGAAVALFVGLFGYKCVKLLCGLGFGAAGFAIGYELLKFLNGHFGWKLPGFVAIIAGGVLLIVLGFLAFKKFAYALFGLIGFSVFVFAYFVYPNYLVAAVIGVVVALLSTYFVRMAVAVITSFIGSFTLVGMLSAILPQISYINYREGLTSKMVAIMIFLVFVGIQLGTTMPAKKAAQGVKRVKIRRVFDGW